RAERFPATDDEKRMTLERMVKAFTMAGFFGRPHDARTIAELRDIVGRASLDKKDVKLLMGMFKNVIRAIGGRE
ncbi:MAG: hypothetical protein HQK87_06750, partial [Nitrospinae bacterium]|nr:hypothetical protein [Nitrospinota bacterium]